MPLVKTCQTALYSPRHLRARAYAVKMWTCAALLLMASGFSLGYICPDGNRCPDTQTCCASKTLGKFFCCPYSNAMCCADNVHCCPAGKFCNAATLTCEQFGQDSVPMLKKVEPQEPSSQSLQAVHHQPWSEYEHGQEQEMTLRKEMVQPSKTKAVWCDKQYTCKDGYSCCFSLVGKWWCCAYSPSKCCLNGAHCCPYGFDCDKTYTKCERQGLPYPFAPRRPALASVPADYIPKWENQVYEQEI